jgi:(2Fe-2S) ferredoxin
MTACGADGRRVSRIGRMSYYERHIFFCLNQRDSGEACCAHQQAQAGFDRCQAGCLDRCAGGPVAVVYPEGVWYTYVDAHDIDEIVESHLVRGEVVERLRLPPSVGR